MISWCGYVVRQNAVIASEGSVTVVYGGDSVSDQMGVGAYTDLFFSKQCTWSYCPLASIGNALCKKKTNTGRCPFYKTRNAGREVAS